VKTRKSDIIQLIAAMLFLIDIDKESRIKFCVNPLSYSFKYTHYNYSLAFTLKR